MDIDWCMNDLNFNDEQPSERPYTPPMPTHQELISELEYLLDRLDDIKRLLKLYN